MMNAKINWKARFKNPVFWFKMGVAIFVPMLAGVGLAWEDITTWPAFFGVISAAAANPVTVLSVLLNIYTQAIDPTTPGIGDSKRALEYKEPGKLDD